jgi:integrase/recombinase XerD
MKIDRHGQSAIIDKSTYGKIRDGFLAIHHQLLWDIAYYTGERWGAIVQLQVSDVYDDRGRPRPEITYRKATRKDQKTRTVPVCESLRLRLQGYTLPEGDRLFPGQTAGTHMCLRSVDGALRRAIARAGLSGLGISSHSTRRSFITTLDRKGISIRVIQDLTGHASIANVQRYIEVTEDQRAAAMAVL